VALNKLSIVHDRSQGGSFCQPSPSIHDICLHLIMVTKSVSFIKSALHTRASHGI